ncbi:LacI family DNA-binding transcriptional regulator [Marinobacter sp. SS13-12]|uniref:LacI family DNA-binding transcriptional regulator n=1 Tax=Marinobacter sp. SS13-12 TaxID=3050451 RepID=UPI002556D708|nr:LacI family DNA-binding transcriptional regulator [Marinobacter sp. SS13-12]MDK8462803.1 LacI family DNA-binding transcriptional regulator [Marinobacter sp. SS13-12]
METSTPENRPKRLTVKLMAEKLNVSTATISNAFNRPDQLSEARRRWILEECKRHGYLGPNAAARSLRTGRTGNVGVMLADNLAYSLTDPVASEFLHGLAEVFDQKQMNMLLLSSKEDDEHRSRVQEAMVDGFIVYGWLKKGRTYDRLLQHGKQMVAVDFDLEGCTWVNIDNYEGARCSAEHALKTPPTNVAIMGLRLVDTDRVCRIRDHELFSESRAISVRRLRGYLDALEAAGHHVSSDRIWSTPTNTHQDAYQAAREALTSNPRPDLMLCMSDRIALAAIQAALQMGLRVPEDVRIVGFDGIPEGANLHPSLTTVYQQSAEKGRTAARIFLGEKEDRNVLLPTCLLVRESCP